MIECKIYKVKEEFLPLLNISEHQWKKRREDLLDWLSDFFDFEIIHAKPICIKINEVYTQNYRPLPRKNVFTAKEKRTDYTNYLIVLLGSSNNEFKPFSKVFMARSAINDFAYCKYDHESEEAIVKRYILPVLKIYAEKDEERRIWCWNTDCVPLNEEELKIWKDILRKTLYIKEDNIFELYDKIYNNESLEKEKNAYMEAIKQMSYECGRQGTDDWGVPVCMHYWRLNEEGLAKMEEAEPQIAAVIKEYNIDTFIFPDFA